MTKISGGRPKKPSDWTGVGFDPHQGFDRPVMVGRSQRNPQIRR
jgi:hypothetical protein